MQVPMLLRGLGESRRVRMHTSHPAEVQCAPDRFALAAQGLSEVVARVRPMRTFGRLEVLVHAVDEASHELVHALVVAADVGAPQITRAFECEVPTGAVVHKKFAYTNRCGSARVTPTARTYRCGISVR